MLVVGSGSSSEVGGGGSQAGRVGGCPGSLLLDRDCSSRVGPSCP